MTLLLRVRGNSPTELWALERRREFDRQVPELVAKAARVGEVRGEIDPGLATKQVANSFVQALGRRGHDGE